MRYDIFLSSLLFGITLLTCTLAITHLMAGALLQDSRLPVPVRRTIRMLMLGTSISASLLLFLVRLSGDLEGRGFLDFRVDGARTEFFPRRVASIDASVPASEDAESPAATSTRTWTLYDKSTRELRSQRLQAQVVADVAPGFLVWSGAAPDSECRSWIDRARALGLEPRVARPTAAALQKGAAVVACAGVEADRVTWERVREHVFSGGSLLFVGKPEKAALDEIQSMMRIRAWRDPDRTGLMRIVFGGPRLVWGGFPSGLLVHLGAGGPGSGGMFLADVAAGTGDALLVREEEELDVGNPASRRLAALVLGEFGMGRVAWTSLPARLSGKLELMHGTSWEVMTQRVLAHLVRAPQAGLEAWPEAQRAPVAVALHVDTPIRGQWSLNRIFQARKIPTSHYVVQSRLEADPEGVAALVSGGAEVGAGDMDADARRGGDFYSRFDRVRAWLSKFEEASGTGSTAPAAASRDPAAAAQAAKALPRLTPGGVTVPGSSASADQYAAFMANRFAYALIDPFADQTSPFRVHLAPTEKLMLHFADAFPVVSAPSLGNLVVWPQRGLDDMAMLRGTNESSSNPEALRSFLEQFRASSWAGGPFLLRVSSAGLGKSGRHGFLEKLLDAVRREGGTFLDPGTLVSWWDGRSEIEVTMEPVDPADIPADLRARPVQPPLAAREPLPEDEAPLTEEEAEARLGRAQAQAPVETENLLPRPLTPEERPVELPASAGRKDPVAWRIWIRNTGSRTLPAPVVRMTEPRQYRVLGREVKVETVSVPAMAGDAQASGRLPSVRVTRIRFPDLEPGESWSAWLRLRDRQTSASE